MRSLYVHVPFCSHKCHYCDFYSLVDTRDRQEAFVSRLVGEFAALAPWAGALRTIFVGGGTPSLLRLDLWDRVLEALAREFDLSGLEEFTVECNPESLTRELAVRLRAGGVTRISMGAQSFHHAHLRTLERTHDPENVPRAIEAARNAGIDRLSVDLIFAIPGQTPAEWRDDLRRACDLRTTHLSCYALTYEPGTAMTARRARGEFTPADEEVETDMYESALDLLRAAGLARYEVSNFARPGQECRHNLAYWRQEDWLAAGPSASAHVAGHRWKNVARLDDYLDSPTPFSPIVDLEAPEARRALRERLMMGIRLAEGLDRARVLDEARSIDPAAAERLEGVERRQRAWGALDESVDRWRLTDRGFLVADAVARDLIGAIR